MDFDLLVIIPVSCAYFKLPVRTVKLTLSLEGSNTPEVILLDLHKWLRDKGVQVTLEVEPPTGKSGGKPAALLIPFESTDEVLHNIYDWQQQYPELRESHIDCRMVVRRPIGKTKQFEEIEALITSFTVPSEGTGEGDTNGEQNKPVGRTKQFKKIETLTITISFAVPSEGTGGSDTNGEQNKPVGKTDK